MRLLAFGIKPTWKFMWLGATINVGQETAGYGYVRYNYQWQHLEVWLCLIPMLPVHLHLRWIKR